jgi:[acyl-carrier-protein] S-malonyltransferase
MAKDLYNNFPLVRRVFEQADDLMGIALSKLIFSGPAGQLQETINAQPAIFITSIAIREVLMEEGVLPQAAAGHSLGEYSALVTGGVLGFSDGLRLVRRRGEFMQDAALEHPGGMAAIIGLSMEQVQTICREAQSFGLVVIANLNCPGQIVISGEDTGIARAMELAKDSMAKRAIRLSVSGPWHSPLMKSAQERLALEMMGIAFDNPRIPIVANVNADYYTRASRISDSLIRQMCQPVLWESSMKRLIDGGFRSFVEVGPGSVLKNLMRRIDSSVRVLNVEDMKTLKETLRQIKD